MGWYVEAEDVISWGLCGIAMLVGLSKYMSVTQGEMFEGEI